MNAESKSVRRAAEHLEVMAAITPCPKPAKKPRTHKRRSKSERKILEAKLWKLTADYVKVRDGCCVTCGATERLTISHWIPAGKQIIRYDTINCNTQCSACNNAHNYWKYKYDNYMMRKWGMAEMLRLTELATVDHWKWPVTDLREMVTQAEQRLVSA